MMRLGLIGAVVLLCLGTQCAVAMAASSDGGGTAELARLNAEIIHRPNDTALNLRYGALAERLHLPRLALSAYERILSYDPQNVAALEGVYRVRKAILPPTTQYRVGVGANDETNPTLLPSGHTPEGQFFGYFNVRDERMLGDTQWRTDGDINGIAHGVANTLDYAYAGATTGPVYEMLPGITANPALGAGGSYLDSHLFYGEAIAQTTFEAYPNGAYDALQIRAALRDYDSFFVPDNTGGYVDATGKITLPITIPDLAFTVAPWLRWAAIRGPLGLGATTPLIGVQPGDYTEAGARFDAYYGIHDWVVFNANISGSDRAYREELVTGSTTEEREDTTISPGASIIFPHLFQYQNTLRFNYTYVKDDSNDSTKSYVDNIWTVTASRNF